MKLSIHDIISCTYGDKTRVLQIQSIRDLRRSPLKDQSASKNYTDSKYLYTCVDYNGDIKSFYDAGLQDVIILSNQQFANIPLEEHFYTFNEEYIQEQQEKIAKLTSSEHALRLKLKDVKPRSKVKIVLFDGKTKNGEYLRYAIAKGKGVIFYKCTGLNIVAKVQVRDIKQIISK